MGIKIAVGDRDEGELGGRGAGTVVEHHLPAGGVDGIKTRE